MTDANRTPQRPAPAAPAPAGSNPPATPGAGQIPQTLVAPSMETNLPLPTTGGRAPVRNQTPAAQGDLPREHTSMAERNFPPMGSSRSVKYEPVKVTFLSGPYRGRQLDLGMTINEASNEQSAEWQDQQSQAIRVGQNFVNISSRQFSVTTYFWSLTDDVSHWVENLFTLHEIGAGEASPPRVHYQQGSISARPCVCTRLAPKYEQPFPDGKGFRQATVELGFKLLGGNDSPHRFAKPLTPDTNLQMIRRAQTPEEFAREGQALAAVDTLAPCIDDPKGREQLTEALKDQGKMRQPSTWNNMDLGTFIQAAAAGLIPPTVMQDPAIQARVREGLARRYANTAYGIRSGQEREDLYGILRAGGGTYSNQRVRDTVENNMQNFNTIVSAIQTQDLNPQSAAFNGPTGELMIQLASCGLELRQANTERIAINSEKNPRYDTFWEQELGNRAEEPGAKDQYLVQQINAYLRTNPTNEEIRDRFGLASVAQAQTLRSAQQYQDRDQFIRYLSTGSTGISGQVAYETFFNRLVDEKVPPKDEEQNSDASSGS